MADITRSECIYHPGKPAVNQCKQCGATTCHTCTVTGPSGRFCSSECEAAHRARLRGASQQAIQRPPTLLARIRKLARTLLVLAVLLIAAGLVGSVFNIPVLTPLTFAVRNFLGI